MTNGYRRRDLDSYVIENIQLWTDDGVRERAHVVVRDGRLIEIGDGSNLPADLPRVDGGGCALMPAGVDAQVHLRVPGQMQKETPETGLLAALKGGYSAVLTMPNTQPTIDSVSVLERGRREVEPFEKDFGVHVFWTAAITKHLNSNDLTDHRHLVDAGVRAFTNDGLGVASDEVMDQAFANLEELGVPLLQHAEFLGHGGSLAPGPLQAKVGASPYPDEPEWQMVERDLRELRKHARARYHVLHVSSAHTVEVVRRAKAEGLNVTCEVTPHHLYFNTETMDGENPAFKMNPPIRGPADQRALWEGLRDGTVDFVATDHAPHEALMKCGKFDDMAFGTLGLETTMNVLVWGLKQGWLTPERLLEVWAVKPAEFLRLPEGIGRFRMNAPFHAVWVDVNAPARVYSEDNISSLSKNSCFTGSSLPGRIRGAFHERRTFTFP